MGPRGERTDRELVDAIAAGDDAALTELYERYSGPLFDFTVRIVRRSDVAADVVQSTFIKAWTAVQRGNPPAHPKAWLYSIARNEAIDQYRKQHRSVPVDFEDESSPFELEAELTSDTDPELKLRDQEIAEIVWTAAAALGEDSLSLLDLQLRQELTGDQLAEALGVSTQNAYKKMSRLRESLEEAVGDEVLRRDPGECEELEALIERFPEAELTPTARRAISKHVRNCELCEERRRRLTSPAALFARFAVIPLPALLDARIQEGIREAISDGGGGSDAPAVTDSGPASGSPAAGTGAGATAAAATTSTRPSRLTLVIGFVAAVVVVVVLLVLLRGGDDGAQDPDDAASTSHEVGVASADRTVDIAWTPPDGADAYSIEWSGDPDSLPDQEPDLPGSADATTSPELDDGSWYFHLRTRNDAGDWTSTVHLGPYEIAGEPEPSPTTSMPEPSTTLAPATTVAAPTSEAADDSTDDGSAAAPEEVEGIDDPVGDWQDLSGGPARPGLVPDAFDIVRYDRQGNMHIVRLADRCDAACVDQLRIAGAQLIARRPDGGVEATIIQQLDDSGEFEVTINGNPALQSGDGTMFTGDAFVFDAIDDGLPDDVVLDVAIRATRTDSLEDMAVDVAGPIET